MDCPRQEEEQRVGLEVVGRHVLLFDDDSTAAFVNSSDALVPWSGGDSSLLIDRFDARHLLQKLPVRAALKRQTLEENLLEPDAISPVELDAERYRDLENGGSGEDQENRNDPRDEEANKNGAESGNYRSVPFSYTSSGGPRLQEDGFESSSYQPPFPVPEYLQSNLPPTEKVQQIISRTAKFVSEHGGQTEIILRVKQGNNPTFGFLMPDHKLHVYFRYLVDHPELCRGEKERTPDIMENKLHVSGEALSLLGSVYGSGEDDGVLDTSEVRETIAATSAAKPPLKLPVAASRLSGDETKEAVKVSAAAKEKHLHSIRSGSSTVVPSGAVQNRLKDVTAGSAYSHMSKLGADSAKLAAPVVEPPSSLKQMVEKTAEFIRRNGREFEASLIQQDNKNDKFPFLRPSNLYHGYYLHVLQHTHEASLPQKSVGKESSSDARNVEKQLEAPLQLDRKEKFKMVLSSGSKKDTTDSSSTPSKPPGLSADEAAAAVMAATRGVLVRSQTPADAPKIPSIHIPDAIRSAVEGRVAASADLPNGSSSKADSSASSAADEQQKLKAERLKRAKLFAAMIKGGKLKADNSDHSSSQPAESRAGSSSATVVKPRVLESCEYPSKRHRSGHSERHRRHSHEDRDSDDERHRRHHSSDRDEHSHRSQHHHGHRHREKPSSLDEAGVREGPCQLVSDAKQPSPATEIPDELRAKVRAMLRETL